MRAHATNELYRYNKKYRLDRSRGIQRHVSPDATLAHINLLKSRGWSVSGMAEASGVSDQAIHRITQGSRENIHADTQAAILALHDGSIFERARPTGYVPNTGAQRRLQALMAIGWRHSDLTSALGFSSSNLLHQPGHWITRAKHDVMRRVYEELWSKRGPSLGAAARAAKAGYLPPMAWEDASIDDPDHFPVMKSDFASRHDENSDTFISEVEFFVSLGAGKQEIAERMNETPGSLASRLQRHGRDDLADLIKNSDQLVGLR